jgi:hypothetical protein
MWWRKRGRALFRDYELAVLDAVGAEIGEAGREQLGRQIGSLAMVQRMFDDVDVLLYPNRRGPQRHDPDDDFANTATELRLATVRIAGPAGKGKVTIDGVRGQVFQLTFSPSPKRLGDRRAIRVTQVTLHADPMAPDDGRAALERLASLDGGTRTEYDLLTGDKAPLFWPEETYSVHLDDGEYLVLAQLDDTTFVSAPIEPPRAGIRRFSPDGDPVGDYPTTAAALGDTGIHDEHGRQTSDA